MDLAEAAVRGLHRLLSCSFGHCCCHVAAADRVGLHYFLDYHLPPKPEQLVPVVLRSQHSDPCCSSSSIIDEAVATRSSS